MWRRRQTMWKRKKEISIDLQVKKMMEKFDEWINVSTFE